MHHGPLGSATTRVWRVLRTGGLGSRVAVLGLEGLRPRWGLGE